MGVTGHYRNTKRRVYYGDTHNLTLIRANKICEAWCQIMSTLIKAKLLSYECPCVLTGNEHHQLLWFGIGMVNGDVLLVVSIEIHYAGILFSICGHGCRDDAGFACQ